MSADGFIQLATDGSGKKVATQEITRADGVTVVGLQEVLGEAKVSDTPETYLVGGIVPLSVTTDGRLRVASTESRTYFDFFGQEHVTSAAARLSNIWRVRSPWSF